MQNDDVVVGQFRGFAAAVIAIKTVGLSNTLAGGQITIGFGWGQLGDGFFRDGFDVGHVQRQSGHARIGCDVDALLPVSGHHPCGHADGGGFEHGGVEAQCEFVVVDRLFGLADGRPCPVTALVAGVFGKCATVDEHVEAEARVSGRLEAGVGIVVGIEKQ